VILVALLLTLAVGALAALHAYWGLGGVWPSSSEETLALSVIGDGRRHMPPPWQCFVVAAILLAVAAWPWLVIAMPASNSVIVGLMIIVAAFLMRALAAFSVRWRQRFPAEPFATYDRRYYGPLCFTLSVGYAVMMDGVQI
jgi:hypothetical protein